MASSDPNNLNTSGNNLAAQPPFVTPKPTFADKLHAVLGELSYLEKDKINKFHGYAYISEAAVKKAVKAAFVKHGLHVAGVIMKDLRDGQSTPQSAVIHVTLRVSDGTKEALFEGVASATDVKGDKAVMKATAGACKYALTTGFIIPTGDDPEADDENDKAMESRPAIKPAAKRNVKKGQPAQRADGSW